jgi:hypothetical protein
MENREITTTIHLKLPAELWRLLRKMADKERRTQHNMGIVLLYEAIQLRQEKGAK